MKTYEIEVFSTVPMENRTYDDTYFVRSDDEDKAMDIADARHAARYPDSDVAATHVVNVTR